MAGDSSVPLTPGRKYQSILVDQLIKKMYQRNQVQEFQSRRNDPEYENNSQYIFRENYVLQHDDTLCTGYFEKGTDLLNGKGKKVWPDGSQYEGTFRQGKAEERGYFIDAKNGFVYIGEWQNDKING